MVEIRKEENDYGSFFFSLGRTGREISENNSRMVSILKMRAPLIGEVRNHHVIPVLIVASKCKITGYAY